MCVSASLIRTHYEAIVHFPDGAAFLAVEKPCGCTAFIVAQPSDFERGLPVVEGQPDTADEPASPALRLVA